MTETGASLTTVGAEREGGGAARGVGETALDEDGEL